jgi:Protein of unknown function (DUF3500)
MNPHIHSPEFTPMIIPASETAEAMLQAGIRFLETLNPKLRSRAQFEFEDLQRLRWHYVPREMFDRRGLCLKDMQDCQSKAALALMTSGLSQRGDWKARQIMNLETILAELERAAGTARHARDPGLYYFSVFGDPTDRTPWGWRAEGHHLSLNFTVVNGEWIAPNPFFFGANPAEVRSGPEKGLRILAEEEDLARSLLTNLTGDQRSRALISPEAPADILTCALPKVQLETAEGLPAELMSPEQRRVLDELIHAYIGRLPEELARIELTKLRQADLNAVHFAWAGGDRPGGPHYYRLHGRFFLVEFDNTQNNANHIHTVWRHLEDDFGVDLLRLHHEVGHAPSIER